MMEIYSLVIFKLIGYFNGCGRTTFVMLQGTLCAFGVRLPVSWLMSRQVPVSLFHIGLAIPASTVIQIALCGIYFRQQRAKQILRKEERR